MFGKFILGKCYPAPAMNSVYEYKYEVCYEYEYEVLTQLALLVKSQQ